MLQPRYDNYGNFKCVTDLYNNQLNPNIIYPNCFNFKVIVQICIYELINKIQLAQNKVIRVILKSNFLIIFQNQTIISIGNSIQGFLNDFIELKQSNLVRNYICSSYLISKQDQAYQNFVKSLECKQIIQIYLSSRLLILKDFFKQHKYSSLLNFKEHMYSANLRIGQNYNIISLRSKIDQPILNHMIG
ncbi:hypothetical protein pb186bvf_009426 [Paramecium bursaria]